MDSRQDGSDNRPGQPLETSFLKLTRAVEHIEQTDVEVRRFFSAFPYVLVPVHDMQTREGFVQVRALTQPPQRLGLLAGDALHEIRSALDHFVYRLAGLGGAANPRGSRTQFPIFDTAEAFARMQPHYLKGVPDAYKAMFPEFQPFEPRFALLGPLARLNDRDKHDMINPIVCLPVALKLRGSGFYDVRTPEPIPEYLDDGTVLVRFKTQGATDMEGFDFTLKVRFGSQGGPTMDTDEMRLLIDRVAEILGRFRAAFD